MGCRGMFKLLALCFVSTCLAGFDRPWGPPTLGGGPRKHRLGPAISPSFLRSVPADTRKKILKALFDEDASRAKQQAELESLVKELPEKNQELYKKQQDGLKKLEEEAKKKAEEAIAKLSAASQELAKKVLAAHENLELSRKQEHEEVKKLFEGASEEVRKELASVFPHRPHRLDKGGKGVNKHTDEPHTDAAVEASTLADPAVTDAAANNAEPHTDAAVEASTAADPAPEAAANNAEPYTDAAVKASAAADPAPDAAAN